MQNCIEHIVGLESLQQLEILDLADNQVQRNTTNMFNLYL
jgi:Leucine-rich repeat (LRR) protein